MDSQYHHHHTVTAQRRLYFNIWSNFVTDIDNRILRNKIDTFRNNYPESNISNLKTWHSSYKTHLLTDIFDIELTYITKAANNLVPENKYGRLEISDFWVAIYTKNSYADQHDHTGSKYSFVYYVEADKASSPLKFEGVLDISPQPGMLVVFDSMTKHKVPVMTEDINRSILAGNLTFVPNEFIKCK